MARKAFYSFHYQPDSWRAAKVRNMGVVEGNQPVTDNLWEKITAGGDNAIEKWIDEQMKGKSVAIVLIGEKTAGRKWIKHEIKKAWAKKKGVLGIYVHNLEDRNGNQTTKGRNPFEDCQINGECMSTIVKAYNPPQTTSGGVYNHIKQNLEGWIEIAIDIRSKFV